MFTLDEYTLRGGWRASSHALGFALSSATSISCGRARGSGADRARGRHRGRGPPRLPGPAAVFLQDHVEHGVALDEVVDEGRVDDLARRHVVRRRQPHGRRRDLRRRGPSRSVGTSKRVRRRATSRISPIFCLTPPKESDFSTFRKIVVVFLLTRTYLRDRVSRRRAASGRERRTSAACSSRRRAARAQRAADSRAAAAEVDLSSILTRCCINTDRWQPPRAASGYRCGCSPSSTSS